MRPLRHCCCLILVLSLTGGHLALMQVVAWAGMLATRSAEQGFRAAAASTFSGAEPCPLCVAVQELKAADEQPTQPGLPGPNGDPASKIVKKADAIVSAYGEPTLGSSLPLHWHLSSLRAPLGHRPGIEPPPPRC